MHKTQTKHKDTRNQKRGFTLLFAVLVGSLLFTLGLAIGNIALKEIILSSAGKESEKAFFSADAGTECALYWDIQQQAFPNRSGISPAPIACAGSAITPTLLVANAQSATTEFEITAAPFCAKVRVEKTNAPVAATIIESRGRSDCGAGANPSRVERALRVTY